MDLRFSYLSLILTLQISLLLFSRAAFGAKFTFVNKCDHTVWPGILSNAGSPTLGSTGFELPQDSSRTFVAPAGWSGRFWGRTGCKFSDESGSCQTGDCGSGQAECNGSGAAPPATLAEFTLGPGGLDFYDVSLVDGYNLPMIVETTGGTGMCASTGCVTDLNRACPSELRVRGGAACQSACEAFGSPEYCCSGAFNSPTSCRPSVYSQMFKSACPRSYSYAYDDPTSTFTCSGADYTVTFCPSMPSQKSSKDPTSTTTTTGEPNAETSLSGTTATTTTTGATNAETSLPRTDTTPMAGSESGPGLGVTGSNPEPDFGSGSQAMLADGSWMADMAMGGSARVYCPSALRAAGFIASTLLILSIFS
ncbi:UNVERIFIED_CONTAM: Thaumatin-like protein 1 [Sesamum angustifolium]|uniref:Thaumatin-like protein 1 n=1 Tax=Sesamum angustifolium TaxID=2727405 RepID=A0AAW2NXZ5_9LAMI